MLFKYFPSTVNHVVVEKFALSILGSSAIKNEETSRQPTGRQVRTLGWFVGGRRTSPPPPPLLPATVRRGPLKYDPAYGDFKVYSSHFYSL